MKSFHARSPKNPSATVAARTSARSTERADQWLANHGLAESRSHAQHLISDGRVYDEADRIILKSAHPIGSEQQLHVRAANGVEFVSRAGIKFDGALKKISLDVAGLCCLDIGQSTGGFSDCLLHHGAAKVIGIDVGHSQLHQRLWQDPRVLCVENYNAMDITPEIMATKLPATDVDLLVCDVSFISLKLILSQWPALLVSGAYVLSLVKTQFELGRDAVKQRGIVKDPELYPILESDIRALCQSNGLEVIDYFASSIKGGDGNHEFFVFAKNGLTQR